MRDKTMKNLSAQEQAELTRLTDALKVEWGYTN
jgi:hypothetical protein